MAEYLTIEVKENDVPVWHQIEMISNNPELNLIVPIYMEKEGKTYFTYRIDELRNKNIDEYFESKVVDPADFCKFIQKIICELLKGEKYFLETNSYMLDSDKIFIGADIVDIGLVYFPCKSTIDINIKIKELFLYLISQKIMFCEGREFIVATLLSYFKSTNFNLFVLNEVCEGLIREKTPEKTLKASYEEQHSDIEGNPSQKGRESNHSSGIIKAQVIFAVFGMLILVTPISNYFTFFGSNPKAFSFFALAIIDIIVVVILKTLVFRNKFEIEENQNTMMLKDMKMIFGTLVEKNIKDGIKFELSSLIVIIGRDKETVDLCCENMAVGKRHAQLHFHDGAYYISDLNSRNGTFVNGMRIENNKEKQISHGDEICFANSGFVFEQNSKL
ncbi:MAG: FHA domain-containing protein [Bacillota bacterium]